MILPQTAFRLAYCIPGRLTRTPMPAAAATETASSTRHRPPHKQFAVVFKRSKAMLAASWPTIQPAALLPD